MLHPVLIVFADDSSQPLIAAVIAAILGPIGAYLVAARKMSGKIGTSDADQLWAESKAIRDWSTDRMKAQEQEIQELRTEISRIAQRCTALEEENAQLRSELNTAHEHIATLEGGGVDGR